MRNQWRFVCLLGLWFILITVASPSSGQSPSSGRPSSGQGLLDRLENRIRQRIGSSEPTPPPNSSTPPADNQTTGRVSLGLEAEERGFQAPYQIVVVSVRPGSPAAEAGMQPNDVIVAIDGRPVGTIDQIAVLVQGKQAGDPLRIDFSRGERAVQATARLTAFPPGSSGSPLATPAATLNPLDAAASNQPPSNEPPSNELQGKMTIDRPDPGSGRLGVTVENVATTPPAEGVPVKRGAVVVAIRPGSPAEVAGIRDGNVIVSIDGFIIQDAANLIDRISQTRPGQRVELGVYQADKLTRKPIVLADADGLASTASVTQNPAETAQTTEPPAAGGLIGGLGDAFGNLFGGANKPAATPGTLPRPPDPPALATLEPLPVPSNPKPIETSSNQPIPKPTSSVQPLPSPEVESLKLEIRQLREQLDALQQRLNDLEG